MKQETDGFLLGLIKWDTLLGQRVLDAISFLVPALLIGAFAIAPKAGDLQNAAVQFGVLFLFMSGSLTRLVTGWNRLRDFRFQVVSALFDVSCLFAFLLIIPVAYGSPIAISLKAPTASLLFVFIVARIVLFDLRLILWVGLSAAIGWLGLTLLALLEPGSPGITRDFIDYTTSDQILIGAQIEHIITILLVTAVSAAVVNAYQRDGLTGLRKKREFLQALTRKLPRRSRAGPTAVILVRVENWHTLANANKASANQAFKAFTKSLMTAPVPSDMAARYEQDSLILWKRCAEDDSALLHHLELLQQRALDVLAPYRLNVQISAVRMEPSLGSAIRDLELAIDQAALLPNRIQICDPSFKAWVETQNNLKTQVNNAIDRGALVVLHQPIVDMLSNQIAGTEALLRLRAEDDSYISPALFIPVAEESGAIDEIGAFVVETASRDSLVLRDAGLQDQAFVSVNVAPHQIHAWVHLEKAVTNALSAGVNLKLEVTESSAAQDDHLQEKLIRLRSRGAKLAIDDFGTGYSSLERLADLPFDTVKIDIAFTRKITTDAGFAMIDAIVRMATASGKDVIIEGIETAEQQALALKAGIRYGQGFKFGRPSRIDDLIALIDPAHPQPAEQKHAR